MPFRGGQGKWQVSANGGTAPEWSKDGKELYYLDPTFSLFAVPVKDAGGAPQFGAAQTLVTNWTAPNVCYDVAPDGKKILLDRVSQQVNQSVTVVTNFYSPVEQVIEAGVGVAGDSSLAPVDMIGPLHSPRGDAK